MKKYPYCPQCKLFLHERQIKKHFSTGKLHHKRFLENPNFDGVHEIFCSEEIRYRDYKNGSTWTASVPVFDSKGKVVPSEFMPDSYLNERRNKYK